MTWQQRTRRGFDIGVTTGLLLLILSLWFGHPKPQWKAFLKSANESCLGFSCDNQHLYTIRNSYFDRGQQQKGPFIASWSVQNGQLAGEYPLQIPVEDRAMVGPFGARVQGLQFFGHLEPESHWLRLYRVCRVDDKLVPGPGQLRLYDMSSGKCITKVPIEDNLQTAFTSANDRILAIDHNYDQDTRSQLVRDLITGERVHAIESSKRALCHSLLSADGRFILLFWFRIADKDQRRFDVEWYRVDTWDKVFQATIEGYENLVPIAVRADRLMLGNSWRDQDTLNAQLLVYRFDPERRIFEIDERHPSHGLHVRSGSFIRCDKYLIATVHHDPNAGWRRFLEQALRRFGVQPAPTPPPVEGYRDKGYRVYDLDSGRLLRQLSGVSQQKVALSSDAQYVAVVSYGANGRYPQLTLFQIPHWLWERTWTTTFYFALLLIIIWPFRFVRWRLVTEFPLQRG